jgi:CRISPR/Cas system CMR subunit Cmr4 (Cas7 group RAMP superfamily)
VPNNRIQIDYALVFSTPFHCGTGIRVGLIDRSIIRDSDGYLYVPGSTFKGVLREQCERLARFYAPNEDQQELITSPHEEEAALRGLGQVIPMTTRIFGSHNHPGRLFFNDARQSSTAKLQYDSSDQNKKDAKGKYQGLQVQVSTQVRLDRPTRTAVKGALYTSEFGVRDVTFEGSITGWLECSTITQSLGPDLDAENSSSAPEVTPDDKPTYSLLLLLSGLMMIECLGGNKSTGKGHCACTIEKVRINAKQYEAQEWLGWLEHLHVLTSYPSSVS